MRVRHLTSEQILALRDGELDDPELASHVWACTECRARLREARILRLLLVRPEAIATSHLDPEDMAAFFDGTLSHSRIREVEGHLAGCPECFADLHGLHRLDGASEAVEAPPAWIAVAIDGFRPVQSISLGRLVVKLVDQLGFRLNLLPWPSPDRPGVTQDAASDSYGPVDFGFVSALAVSAPTPKYSWGADTATRSVEVPVGTLTLQINAVERSMGPMLEIWVRQLPEKYPASGVELTLQPAQLEMRFQPDQVAAHSATTGSDGRVEFVLPPGASTLIVRGPVHAELTIEFQRFPEPTL